MQTKKMVWFLHNGAIHIGWNEAFHYDLSYIETLQHSLFYSITQLWDDTFMSEN